MNSLTLLSVFNNHILYFLSAFLLQNFDFRTDFESIYKLFITIIIKIITTGLAGGLLTPYKGLLPALESKDSANGSPAATSFTY